MENGFRSSLHLNRFEPELLVYRTAGTPNIHPADEPNTEIRLPQDAEFAFLLAVEDNHYPAAYR